MIEKSKNDITNQEDSRRKEILLSGKVIYEPEKPGDTLLNALNYAGNDGIILTLPELVEAVVLTGNSEHEYWNHGILYTYSQEAIGSDRNGVHYEKDTEVVLTVHGSELIRSNELTSNKLSDQRSYAISYDDFDQFLAGKDLANKEIPIYKYEDFKAIQSKQLEHKFAIVAPTSLYKEYVSQSEGSSEQQFTTNPIIICRAGGSKFLSDYYHLAKSAERRCGFERYYFGMTRGNPYPIANFLAVQNGRGKFCITEAPSQSRYLYKKNVKFIAIKEST